MDFSEEDFKTSLNIISGYFCSSVSRIKPETVFVKKSRVFTSLHQESLCTENLQPFIDLLPCRDVSGLASMIRTEVLHKNEYYSMQIHFKKSKNNVILQAKIYLVNDLNRWSRQGSNFC
jgi:phosphatidylinositol glycan class T